MKIIVELDDGNIITYQNVNDAYLCINQAEPFGAKDSLIFMQNTRSYSWGADLRSLAKEIYQSLMEIQDTLRKPKVNA